jgi:hypothetical protein
VCNGAVHRAVLGLLDPDTACRPDRTTYAFLGWRWKRQVHIEDEDGKIILDAAPLELLGGAFQAIGLARDQAQAMADRMANFRDEHADAEPLGRRRGCGPGRGTRPRPCRPTARPKANYRTLPGMATQICPIDAAPTSPAIPALWGIGFG